MKHNFLKILKSKAFYIVAALLVQVGILLMLMGYFSSRFLPVYYFMILLSFMMCFHIINRDSDSSSKLLWVLIIMALPIFGGMIYLLFGGRKIPKALMVKDRQAYSDYKKYALQNKEALETNQDDFVLNKMVSMAWNNGYFPVYDNVQTDYFETGQDQFASILEDLKKAEHFIFIETFILNSGIMWDSILEILIDKAAQGVDIRLIYDDFGSFTKLDDTYPDWLATKGIKTYSFNPMIPQLAMQMNNRDHRKIIVIDGKIAYTGGINIADEYINQKERFGYWKDMGVRIQGKAVEMFTISFLQIWNYQASENIPYDLFTLDAMEFNQIKGAGYCIPFSDSPTDDSNTGKNMHLNQLMLASRYCWLTTPYLILDQEMMDTLILAANNGVDVRIVVPAIPDKKMVYQVTKANFEPLLKKGVKIYVYTPGFIHGKVCLSDDRNALVGTVNMDFRSYYLNYECGVWFHDTSNLPQIKQDFEQIFQDSHEVTLEEVKNEKLIVRLYRQFLRIFSPLM
jgi:cardiolipin synthase